VSSRACTSQSLRQKTLVAPYEFRTDLYGVRVLQQVGTCAEWVLERVFRSCQGAKRYRRAVNLDLRRPYVGVSAMIVHPRQIAVEAYVAMGNRIEP
jgi:hypothetical protein